MTNNYFRVGQGARAVYVFFDDRLEKACQAAWTKAQPRVRDPDRPPRIGVWRTPMCKGPWRAEAVIINDRFGLDMGLGFKGNGQSVCGTASDESTREPPAESPESVEHSPSSAPGPGGRSKLGPVLS